MQHGSGWHGAKRDGYNTFEQWYVNKGDNWLNNLTHTFPSAVIEISP